MSDGIRKRPVRRKAVDESPMEGGASPLESSSGSACGHSHCDDTCRVRYIGAVSHVRDHHAMHAARGVGHIWAASIVTGFAVVLTSVFAFNSVQARSEQANAASRNNGQGENRALMERLDKLERLLMETRRICAGEPTEQPDDQRGLPPPMRTQAEIEAEKQKWLNEQGSATSSRRGMPPQTAAEREMWMNQGNTSSRGSAGGSGGSSASSFRGTPPGTAADEAAAEAKTKK